MFASCFLVLLAAQAEWKAFSPADGSFSVRLPAAPTEFKKSVKVAGGTGEVMLFEVTLPQDAGKLVVGYTEFPAGAIKPGTADKRLDNARDGALASTKGTMARQKILLLGNCPGREVLIKIDAKTFARVRLYAVRNRLYQMVALGSEEWVASKEAEMFLGSLAIARERAVARRWPDC